MPYANVNDTRLYYTLNGAGPPLLLIPGLGLDHTYYDLAIPSCRRGSPQSASTRAVSADLTTTG